MNSFTPGIIIALLIVFLLGILVGYALVQRRLRQQAEDRKVAQRRLTEMEQSHELRLREATDQLRRDYESQLATTIEHYQDQLSQKTIEMEQIYETRFRVLQQGEAPAPAPSLATAGRVAAPARPAASPPYRGVEAIADDTPQALTQPELMHLKRQYEIRLKEAAQKLQKAYETQLAEHAKAARADLKAEYEQQLAAKQQEFVDRQADLEQELATLRSQTETLQARLDSGTDIPTPSQIMGIGDDTTVTLAASSPPEAMAPSPDAAQYTQAQLDEQVQAATEQTAAEYEQRLTAQVQAATQQAQAEYEQRLTEQVQAATQQAQTDFDRRLTEQVQAATQQAQAEFDRQLTEQLEAQQVQFDRRFRELEAEHKAKLIELANAAPESVLSPVDELFGDNEYDDLAAQSEPASTDNEISDLEDDLFAEEDFFSATPADTSTDDSEGIADLTGELEDDLFADDFFADPPADKATTTQTDDGDDDDDDDFMPLDLSDIS